MQKSEHDGFSYEATSYPAEVQTCVENLALEALGYKAFKRRLRDVTEQQRHRVCGELDHHLSQSAPSGREYTE